MSVNSFNLVISEIMYNPQSTPDNVWEWLEISNIGDTIIDLSGYVIDDNNTLFHSAANINSGTIIPGGTAILFNHDELEAADFEAAWGDHLNLIGVTGWSKMGLNNGGDKVSLWSDFESYINDHQDHLNAIDTVDYAAANFPNPNGSSIYLTDLTLDNNIGLNWSISLEGETTPSGTGYFSNNFGGNLGNDLGSPVPNFPPTITGTPDKIIDQESLYIFQATTNDINGDTLIYSIENLPDWAEFDIETGILSGTPRNEDIGIFPNIKIAVSDGLNQVNLPAFDLTVQNINDYPYFTSSAPQLSLEDQVYRYEIVTADPDFGDSLTITANSLPNWLNLVDHQDGTATLTGTPTNDDVGIYHLELQVKDAANATAIQKFSLTIENVNDPPILDNQSFIINENTINHASIGLIVGNDKDNGDRLSYEIISGNESNIFTLNSETGEISILDSIHLDYETNSRYQLIVQVQDLDDLTDHAEITIDIKDINESPIDLILSHNSINENEDSETIVGEFKTIDPDIQDFHHYHFVSGWGDTDNNKFTIIDHQLLTQNSFDFEDQDLYTIRVQTIDSQGLQFQKQFNIEVNNIDEKPTVKNEINDFEVYENAEDMILNLSDLFTDIDNHDDEIKKVIKLNSYPELVNATLEDNILRLDYQNHQHGTAEITIEAISNDQTVTTAFTVLVHPVEEEIIPEVIEPQPEIVEPQPEIVEPKPEIVEPEIEVEIQPEVIEPETEVEMQPEVIEPEIEVEIQPEVMEPEIVEPQPEIVKPEIEVMEPQPEIVEPEIEVEIQPEVMEPKPEVIEPEIEVEMQPEIIETEIEVKAQPEIMEPEIKVEMQPETENLEFIEPLHYLEIVSIFDPTEFIPVFYPITLEKNILFLELENLNHSGTEKRDIIIANSTTDPIFALDHDDMILGSHLNNWINGNHGNDHIEGEGGNDTVYGGQDDDTIIGNMGHDQLTGDTGNDRIEGNQGNDIIFGSIGRDTLMGGAEDDIIYGNLGEDILAGNSGQDLLYGGQDDDTISGNKGDDTLYGDHGHDWLDGNIGDDILVGGSGNDVLDGGSGQDILKGSLGDDTLVGAAGNDTLTGEAGQDYFVLVPGYGTDLITDFEVNFDYLILDGGLEFDQITIEYHNHHVLIKSPQERLAILENVDINLINIEQLFADI